MKKLIYITIVCFFCAFLCLEQFTPVFAHQNEPMLAIVIDDFGQSRKGVAEMLNLKCPLTCAVMPGLEYSIKDANDAHSKGHEVILHMPMEAHIKLPDSWYGPEVIRNYDTPEKAKKLLAKCIDETPHCEGVNIHIGSGVCLNKKLVTAILEETKLKGKYFLDSRTHEGSVCGEVAPALSMDFIKRDFFLEEHGKVSLMHSQSELLKAANLATTQGYAVAIGHVGPEGGITTANAIANCLPQIEDMGVKIVPLSKIINTLKVG